MKKRILAILSCLLYANVANAENEWMDMESRFFSIQNKSEQEAQVVARDFAIALVKQLKIDLPESNRLEEMEFSSSESYLGDDEEEPTEAEELSGKVARMSNDLFIVQKALVDQTYKKAIDIVTQAGEGDFVAACNTALGILENSRI